ncbi:hypothetical protein [Haladaptatus sp. YSMS36]|uniref:hypothetical protein n=1 Tax=Haladaptatus sp. YSMS36 TaxID=3033384 RepID=UPI0023E8D4C7|nr:hypothetical protein [Haladaptatus sp. YSMS36]
MSLRDSLYAPEGIWTDDIEALLRELDAFDEGWEVRERSFKRKATFYSIASDEHYQRSGQYSYPTDRVQFAYMPENLVVTDWVAQTNWLSVWYIANWDTTYDADGDDLDDPNDRGGREKKYVITGTFVDPLATRDVSRAAEHVAAQFARIEAATETNADIERCGLVNWFRDGEPAFDNPFWEEYTMSPIRAVNGVGTTTIERLSRTFGTYHNLVEGDDNTIADCTSGFHRVSSTLIKEAAADAVDRYRRFATHPDWTHSTHDPASWTEYPKPNILRHAGIH